ncbi:MAG: glycerol-3-phosphate acyltransferase [Dehalococcoidia bacterium]|nr:glycerol-3-phosphate acyltransferase [Dehalococcoidia bacterium]MDH4367446.1 glycerol-3-phosphate acyltransferase [Dehalococcoidia bacterium]
MPLGILGVIIGYLLGSIPTAYIVSRVRTGIDIRTIGSGNMGGANVMREIGTREGVFVGLFDIAKGAGAILIAQGLNVSELWIFGAGFAAVVGHSFPVFAGFRGGRGSATIIGIFLVLAPMATLVTLVVVAIPFFTSRKFGGAIIIGFGLLPLFIWLLEGSLSLVRYALVVDLFMLIRALPDIRHVLGKGIIKDMIRDRWDRKTK